MKIIINRQSVCMADDCFDHEKIYTMKMRSTCKDLFELLKKDHYFPNIFDDNVVWVLTAGETEYIFSYFTLIEKYNAKVENERLATNCEKANSKKLFLKYCSSPEHWENTIHQKHLDAGMDITNDYWNEELKYCDYIASFSKQQIASLQQIKEINKREYTILIKCGSMCFYGEWFGRPYDNYHQIIKTFYENDWLEIYFLEGESLLIQKPLGIINHEKHFKVNDAKTVIWKYYGDKRNVEKIYMYKKVDNSKYLKIINDKEIKFVPIETIAVQYL